MIQRNIARVAISAAALASGLRNPEAITSDFVRLHLYAIERRDKDAARQFPSEEVLARKFHEMVRKPFPASSFGELPAHMQILFATFRAMIAALEPFRWKDRTPLDREIEDALDPSLQALADGAGAEGIPDDVKELVIAARVIAYSEDGADPEDHKRLDKATEAFAERVPWDDEPTEDGGMDPTNESKDSVEARTKAAQADMDEAAKPGQFDQNHQPMSEADATQAQKEAEGQKAEKAQAAERKQTTKKSKK